MNAFGTKFMLVNKVRQFLPSPPFQYQRFLHLATIVRGLKEYCAFADIESNSIYIEEVDARAANLFVKIQSDSEWRDLYGFLMQNDIVFPTEYVASEAYNNYILNDKK